MADRKNFGETFEGKGVGSGIPEVTLRRMTEEEMEKLNLAYRDETVGIFHGSAPIAIVMFDDIYDHQGNRFYND